MGRGSGGGVRSLGGGPGAAWDRGPLKGRGHRGSKQLRSAQIFRDKCVLGDSLRSGRTMATRRPRRQRTPATIGPRRLYPVAAVASSTCFLPLRGHGFFILDVTRDTDIPPLPDSILMGLAHREHVEADHAHKRRVVASRHNLCLPPPEVSHCGVLSWTRAGPAPGAPGGAADPAPTQPPRRGLSGWQVTVISVLAWRALPPSR